VVQPSKTAERRLKTPAVRSSAGCCDESKGARESLDGNDPRGRKQRKNRRLIRPGAAFTAALETTKVRFEPLGKRR